MNPRQSELGDFLRSRREKLTPKVVGLPVARAQEKLAHLALDVEVKGPSDGRVVKQSLDPGTAAAPGLRLTLSAEP